MSWPYYRNADSQKECWFHELLEEFQNRGLLRIVTQKVSNLFNIKVPENLAEKMSCIVEPVLQSSSNETDRSLGNPSV